jgi:hypothetical protein
VLPLVLVLSLRAFAADDAPVLLKAGDPAPVAGVLLPDALAVRKAQSSAACNVERDALKEVALKSTPLPPLVVVGLIALGVVVGGAAGFGIAKATQPKP